MTNKKKEQRPGYPPQKPGFPDTPDKVKLQILEQKRLAQKSSYTDENRQLIERLINRVQAL
jgi:hypothetical protein